MEPEKLAAQGTGPDARPRMASERREDADRASRVVSDGVDQVVAYGREHPTQFTLIAFGAGVAVGLVLASGARRRRSHYPEIVINALAKTAAEYFRTR